MKVGSQSYEAVKHRDGVFNWFAYLHAVGNTAAVFDGSKTTAVFATDAPKEIIESAQVDRELRSEVGANSYLAHTRTRA